MPAKQRGRLWCWTLNNYSGDERGVLGLAFGTGDIQYACYQPERGENGTPHLQGFMCTRDRLTRTALKRILGVNRIHLEIMRGTSAEAIAYCQKDESRDRDAGFAFCEFGDRATVPGRSGQGTRSDLDEFSQRVLAGEPLAEVAEAMPSTYVQNYRGFESLRRLVVHKPRVVDPDGVLVPPRVLWFWGPTGGGKTRTACREAAGKSIFWKMADNQWFDTYDQQDVMIMDDFRTSWFKFGFLLRLLDAYPLVLEIKCNHVQFNTNFIIITAPKPPQEMYSSLAENEEGQYNQLLRRITEVRYIGPPLEAPLAIAEIFNPPN